MNPKHILNTSCKASSPDHLTKFCKLNRIIHQALKSAFYSEPNCLRYNAACNMIQILEVPQSTIQFASLLTNNI